MNKRRWMQHKSYHNSRAGKDAPNQSRSLQAQPPSSPLAPGMRATPKRAGRRRTQRSPADVPVPISTPPCSDGTAPAHCTGRQRPRAIPPRRSRSCPCHHPSRRGGPGVGPGWTVVPASGSFLRLWRFAGSKAIARPMAAGATLRHMESPLHARAIAIASMRWWMSEHFAYSSTSLL